MSTLKPLFFDALDVIHGGFRRSPQRRGPAHGAAETRKRTEFAPVTFPRADGGGSGGGDREAALALRPSNEEPRSGDGGQLPGTALPGPGTPCSEAGVFMEPEAGLDILRGIDWDVLASGDAAVRILGGDGRLAEPGLPKQSSQPPLR